MQKQPKARLSNSILDMKFMKKTKERVELEDEANEGQKMYSNDITEDMRKGGKYAVVEVGISNCKDLIEGRLSFGGMNPDVESMMKTEYAKRIEQIEKEKEAEISDFEMAKRLNPLVETMSKKSHKNNKRKFMKPMEME